jgi:hypothetical protein
LFVALNVALLGFTVSRVATNAFTPVVSEAALPHDAILDRQSLAPVAALSGGVPTALLVFLTGTESAERLRFLELLASRYSNAELKVLAVAATDAAGIRAAGRQMPILADAFLKIHQSLHIASDHGHVGVAVIRLPDRLVFRALNVDEDSLRQLAERHSLGEVQYAGVPDLIEPLLPVGHDLPDLRLTKIGSGDVAALKTLGRTDTVFVVFGAPCSSCQLTEAMKMAVDADAAKDELQTTGERLIFLFAEQFSPQMITTYMKHLRLEFIPAYIVHLPDELRMITRGTGNTPRPLLVSVNNGVVRSSRRLGGDE